ncbi:MAG: 2-hydroxyacyl-CoA dehydratase family protein, partial [Dehalococcoidia bacterium]
MLGQGVGGDHGIPTQYRDLLQALEGVLRHRQASPTTGSEEVYYQLLVDYFAEPLRAREAGRPVVAHGCYVPPEIFYALGIAPLCLDSVGIISASLFKNYPELAAVARQMGLPVEICSSHRMQVALARQGWLPRPDAVVWSHQICDSSSKTGEMLQKLYETPGYFLDRPWAYREQDVGYYTEELGSLVSFLEGVSGRRMDWDRLCQALEFSQEIARLQGEISALTRAVPSPSHNRIGVQFQATNWILLGQPAGVTLASAIRDELAQRAAAGRGYYPQEKYRLLALYPPPAFRWKLLDWMGREHGACVVVESYAYHWGPWELDPRRPLESLARRCFATPVSRHYHGPPHHL